MSIPLPESILCRHAAEAVAGPLEQALAKVAASLREALVILEGSQLTLTKLVELTSHPPELPESKPVRKILAALGNQPATSKELAQRAGYTYSSRFRQFITDMIREGLIARAPGWLLVRVGREISEK